MTTHNADEAAWSQFWSSGSVTAFYGRNENYDAEYIGFWREVLAEPVDQLIDLACGNGALTWIADEILNQPQPRTRICGIDVAEIDPFAALDKNRRDHPNVSFIGRCSIEALPLETDSVDMAISQYGIEYARIERVLPELGRVLRPRAKLAFILHDAASSVLSSMRITAAGIGFLFESGGYYDLVARLDKIQNKRKTIKKLQGDPQFRKAVVRMQQLTQSIQQFQPPLRDFLQQHISGTNRLFAKDQPIVSANRTRLIKQRRQMLEGTLERYRELKRAALTSGQYDTLIEQVADLGFGIVETGNFVHSADSPAPVNLGWKLVAQR